MSYILVEQSDLAWATQQGLVSSAQAAALWPALVTRTQGRGGLNLAQVAFYAGSLLIIGALTWFMSVVWESSALLFFLALAYVAAFGAAGVKLWFDGQAEYGIPQVVGGLFVTIAVSVAPIVTFAAQRYLDEWPISRGILIELTLVVGGAVALYGVRFPFLTAPISVGLFLMATFDLAQLVWTQPSTVEYGLLSLAFGLAMSSAGFGIDRLKLAQDYGFWLYLFGAFSTYGGLGCLFTSTLLGPYHCAFAIFSTLYIVGGALVNRQSLVVFGSIGVSAYLVWLSSDLFWDSWSYPFVLTAVGLLIIFIGIQVQKYITNKASATTKAAEKNDALSYPYQLLSNAKEAQFAQAHYMPVHMQAPAQHYFVVPVAQPKTVDV